MIVVFGSINVDLVARVDAIPRPGETVLSPGAAQFFGGKGANQAVAAQAAGAQVAMVGAVGPDGFGAECRANFTRRGVDVGALQTVSSATGMAFIAVDAGGENAITVASGANLQLKAEAVPDAVFAGATVCVLQMEVPLEENIAAAARMRAAGGKVLLNLAPAPRDLPVEALERLLALTDILVVNEHEAEVVAALAPKGAAREADLVAQFGFDLVVTLGARGLRHLSVEGISREYLATPVKVVDTTGAGDTFVGALGAYLAQGDAMPSALEKAGAAASRACAWAGAQPPVE